MTAFPGKQLVLESKIAQQRNTIASLKSEGHETADAERYLRQLEEELGSAQAAHIDRANDRAA